jgi:hypothetical protein
MLQHPLSVPEVLNLAPEIGVAGFVLWCTYDMTVDEPCTKVYEGMRMPNGIEVSPDGKLVYIVESTGQRVGLYDVPIEGHGAPLKLKKMLYPGTVCDNLSISPSGRLLSGCHPKAMTYKFLHAKNQKYRSPSQVMAWTSNSFTRCHTPYLKRLHTVQLDEPCNMHAAPRIIHPAP